MNVLERALPALRKAVRTVWAVFWRAAKKYDETDAEQRAASFAYYAFFALFPLIVLLISISATFLGSKERATTAITGYVSNYMPIEEKESNRIVTTIDGVVQSRKSAGLIAFGILAWTAIRFFHALVRGVNRAWGTKEYAWWRLPIKNLFMTAIQIGRAHV